MYLKKVDVQNPLFLLQLTEEYIEYENAQTDDEIAGVYHKALDVAERETDPKRKALIYNFTYAMIAYSTNLNINPLVFIL